MAMEAILKDVTTLPGAVGLEQRPDGWWMNAPELDVVAMAKFLLEKSLRLSTVTAVALENGETNLIYHYVGEGFALNLKTTTRKNHMPSITPWVPAADWIERETHDLYGVEFDGHPNLARLVLPPGLKEGFFRQPGGAAAKKTAAASPLAAAKETGSTADHERRN
jgi:NADH-quinone oxidoreductase subunit C